MEIKKANHIDEIYGAVLSRALEINEIDSFYCEADPVRGGLSARKQLQLKIQQNANEGRNSHFLFVGYRGCGKSTELNHLQKDLDGNYAVLNYSVMKELDPQSIQYIELFIVTMERLFRLADDEQLDIDQDFLTKIVNWTRTKEIDEIREKHFSAEAEAGLETKGGLPFLLSYFVKLKGAAKASKSFKETIRQTLEPRLSDLIHHCNELITVVRMKMVEKGKKDLVIFIEDLDKIPLDIAQKLFFNYAHQLTQLKATVVYTFPVTLYYNTSFGAIRNYFSDTIELPMIKTRQKDGTEYAAGLDVLKKIVDTRINSALFASADIQRKFFLCTGGVIRDLFAMINVAATAAQIEASAMINEDHFTYAYNQLKKEYNNTIADHYDTQNDKRYEAKDFYTAMADLVRSAEKKPDNSAIMMLLRQNLCVLSYNGEGWCDVHPIMKDILLEKGYPLT
ncbi:MAG: hypothetical protein K0Q79_325 [Flavipsychrobacter sp.]|jgi:hypothetical protein|nr:hypothetical protein [Flavipsychrobacter sp.]